MYDWYEEKFLEAMSDEMANEFANIISYNIFQMDGITMCVPYSDTPAKVMDWDTDSFERFDGQPEELSLF